MTEQVDRFFVLAVSIAARLHAVLEDARSISLQAMNAQSLIARSGEQSRSMEPIVDYMNELSFSIVQLVKDVDEEALKISRESLAEFRESVAVDRFEQALQLGEDTEHMELVRSRTAVLHSNLNSIQQGLQREIGTLVGLLSSIETTMLSVNIVTSSLRIEVGNLAAEYQDTFESLISGFETATASIRSVVSGCKTELSAAPMQARKNA